MSAPPSCSREALHQQAVGGLGTVSAATISIRTITTIGMTHATARLSSAGVGGVPPSARRSAHDASMRIMIPSGAPLSGPSRHS
jgi:hypothetical protein